MDMVIGGRKSRVGQFSGVATHPQFRRRGLNRWLTEQAMQWASKTHDGFFLFATLNSWCREGIIRVFGLGLGTQDPEE